MTDDTKLTKAQIEALPKASDLLKDLIGKKITLPGCTLPTNNSNFYFEVKHVQSLYNRAGVFVVVDAADNFFFATWGELKEALANQFEGDIAVHVKVVIS